MFDAIKLIGVVARGLLLRPRDSDFAIIYQQTLKSLQNTQVQFSVINTAYSAISNFCIFESKTVTIYQKDDMEVRFDPNAGLVANQKFPDQTVQSALEDDSFEAFYKRLSPENKDIVLGCLKDACQCAVQFYLNQNT